MVHRNKNYINELLLCSIFFIGLVLLFRDRLELRYGKKTMYMYFYLSILLLYILYYKHTNLFYTILPFYLILLFTIIIYKKYPPYISTPQNQMIQRTIGFVCIVYVLYVLNFLEEY